jgi:L-proline amide hydrolase
MDLEIKRRRDSRGAGAPSVTEGTIDFRGYRTWYRIVGEDIGGRLPVIVLHGGPGATHQYLEPLDVLTESGRRVIFYDQIGCGRSDRPTDPAFYETQTFVDELVTLRVALGLDRVHLIGQSWGGMLAMQYALERPPGLASIVVADSPADMGQWVGEANRLRAALPHDVERVLAEHEAAGTTSAPEYGAAVEIFYRKHVCRLDPWPDPFVRTAEALEHDNFVYLVMNGPSEFHVIGKLASWSILDRLHEIDTPTLLLSGAYDEATPAIVGAIAERIPHAEWVLFEESSHTPHLEQPAAFSATVRAFLAGVESGSRALQTADTFS